MGCRPFLETELVWYPVESLKAEGWTELEAAVLRAADELHSDACITDDTWVVVAEYLDERQLIDLPVLVGQYPSSPSH